MKISPILTKEMQRAKAEQLKFYIPRTIVEEELRWRQVKPQSDIWIYPVYPDGWDGVVAAHDLVYIFESRRGEITSIRVQPPKGFLRNGSIIY